MKNRKKLEVIIFTFILLILLSPVIMNIFGKIYIAMIKMPEDYPATLPLDETLSKQQALTDIRAVFDTISEKHSMKERDPQSFKQVEAAYQEALHAAHDGMTVAELWILTSTLEHSLKDAHSCVRLNIKDFKEYHYLNAEFDIDDNHTIWFVDKEKPYQLLDINGITVTDIYKNARDRLAYENEFWLAEVLKKHLSNAEDMQLLGIPYREDGAVIRFATENGKETKTISYRSKTAADSKPQRPYSASYEEELSLAIFEMNEMNDTVKYQAFVDKFFQEVKTRKLQNIVIDLRNNGGGNSACGEPFLEFLEQDFDGQAYVLTSHKTFSSAMLFTSWLYNGQLATVVGEETGGSPNAYGEVRFYSMPNSRLLYRVTQAYFENDNRARGLDTIPPDIKVDSEQALDKVRELVSERETQ